MNPYKVALQNLRNAVDDLMVNLYDAGSNLDRETGETYTDILAVEEALERANDLLEENL
jgi:hypothetical protein